MKLIKRCTSVLLALVMMLAMSATAFAAGTGSITINNAIVGNTYTVYKVFDADGNGANISYKLMSGKTNAPAGFTVDDAGNVTYTGSGSEDNLTANDVSAIAEYVKNDSPVTNEVTATGTTVTFSNLPNGYYYITTSAGTAVTITSTNPNATVNEKNKAPDVKKEITSADSLDTDGKKALAQVGSTVNYKATIEVGTGAKSYKFSDTMTNQTLTTGSVKVTVDGEEVAASAYGTLTENNDKNGFSISFNDTWIASQVDKNVVITYSATITSGALSVDKANNTATIEYGNNKTTDTDTTEIQNAKITVTKVNESNQPLDGAGFVLKNSEGKYYKLTEGVLSWVDDIDDATELKTTKNDDGTINNVVTFTGLAAGTYTLVEKTVPAGYNKAADKNITIAGGDYTAENLEKAETVENKAGSTLPTTGGMGTTLLYTVGSILVLGAGVLLVVRRRMDAAE